MLQPMRDIKSVETQEVGFILENLRGIPRTIYIPRHPSHTPPKLNDLFELWGNYGNGSCKRVFRFRAMRDDLEYYKEVPIESVSDEEFLLKASSNKDSSEATNAR